MGPRPRSADPVETNRRGNPRKGTQSSGGVPGPPHSEFAGPDVMDVMVTSGPRANHLAPSLYDLRGEYGSQSSIGGRRRKRLRWRRSSSATRTGSGRLAIG